MKFSKPKKTNRKKLKAQADKLFSAFIRSVGACEIAGMDNVTCNGNLQCAHIIGRANHSLRWDNNNALCLCAGHHMYYTNHPWEWVELIKSKFPVNYKYVNTRRNEVWDKNIEAVLEALDE